jgi:hypothetical protein
MPKRSQRGRIEPRIFPIKGSVAAPPVPGTRGVVEDSGQRNSGIADADGRRQDRSAHHHGVAQAAQAGGEITTPSTFAKKRPYVND